MQILSPEDRLLFRELGKRELTGKLKRTSQSIFDGYTEDSPECLWAFLTECCWTFNEADKEVELIPAFEYLKWLAYEWHDCRATGQELVDQKSRRIVVSWLFRGCELWSAGQRQERNVVCGLNYDKSAEHGWRYAFMLRQMARNRPLVYRGGHQEREGNYNAQRLEQVLLPNGSLLETINQDGKSFQGSGYGIVTLEELCLYDHIEETRAQAKIVTQGKAGSKGGLVVSVSNASPNEEWLAVKGEVR